MVNPVPKKAKVISIEALDRLKNDLVKEGLVTAENLGVAELTAQRDNESLRSTLVKSGYVSEEQLSAFMGKKLQIPFVNLRNYIIDSNILDLIPEKIARRYGILPLFKIEDVITVAMSDPLDIISIDDISAVSGCKVEPVIASEESIHAAINQWYGMGSVRQLLVDELIDDCKEITIGEDKEQKVTETAVIRLKKEAEEAPVVRLVNSYIIQAVLEGASDIHLEPGRDSMNVRFRIDGTLYERSPIPASLSLQVTARIKIMARLDISKKRIPQDGRIGIVLRDKHIDIRTSTLPCIYGENIVLRILDHSRGIPTLPELGFSDGDLSTFKRIITANTGIILATGPTGCGKTTTIYSAISTLNKTSKNIMTIEDPIENEIEGAVQSQIDTASGGSFAGALRAILRQDPDIIYIGEMRDAETAEIAIRSALTGHLVFSTLHTNDAVGSIVRLRDMGIDSGLVASVLNCSFAQRLVRKICPKCITEYQPDENMLAYSGLPPGTKLFKGLGCESCCRIGYKGRVGVYEILVADKEIKDMISRNAPENEMLEAAKSHGMRTLFEDGLLKVKKGMTTLEEISNVTTMMES